MILTEEYSDELFNLMCGSVIGQGQYRTVYRCHLKPEWVIKKDSGENFSNYHEFNLWNEYQDTPLGKWLAPVHWISSRGLWLIQAKTESIPKSMLPKKIPAIFADTKLDNWGWLDGRVVCHDYGNSRIYRVARKAGGKLKSAAFT